MESPPPVDHSVATLNLQALSFTDRATLDAYIEALKNALSAASDANGALITASLSIATLYGAIVGLVTPKSQVSPFVIVLPMIPLVLAFAAAVYGKTRGISLDVASTTEQVRADINNVISRQRCGTRIAVALLALGLIAGGAVLADAYGRSPRSETTATVYLSPIGTKTVSSLCDRIVTSLHGTVGGTPVASQDLVIVLDARGPCAGQKLELTPADVAAVR